MFKVFVYTSVALWIRITFSRGNWCWAGSRSTSSDLFGSGKVTRQRQNNPSKYMAWPSVAQRKPTMTGVSRTRTSDLFTARASSDNRPMQYVPGKAIEQRKPTASSSSTVSAPKHYRISPTTAKGQTTRNKGYMSNTSKGKGLIFFTKGKGTVSSSNNGKGKGGGKGSSRKHSRSRTKDSNSRIRIYHRDPKYMNVVKGKGTWMMMYYYKGGGSEGGKGKGLLPRPPTPLPPTTRFPSIAPTQSEAPSSSSPPTSFSNVPSSRPSLQPSSSPTQAPFTSPPNKVPTTASPSSFPSVSPSWAPSSKPSSVLSTQPSLPATDSTQPSASPSDPSADVQASQFIVTYVLAMTGANPSPEEFAVAADITMAHIDEYLESTFSLIPEISYLGSISVPTSTGSDPAVTIDFDVTAVFAEDSETIPTVAALDQLIEEALSEPFVLNLIDQLRRVEGSNPFTTTSSVSSTPITANMERSRNFVPDDDYYYYYYYYDDDDSMVLAQEKESSVNSDSLSIPQRSSGKEKSWISPVTTQSTMDMHTNNPSVASASVSPSADPISHHVVASPQATIIEVPHYSPSHESNNAFHPSPRPQVDIAPENPVHVVESNNERWVLPVVAVMILILSLILLLLLLRRYHNRWSRQWRKHQGAFPPKAVTQQREDLPFLQQTNQI